MEYNPLLFSNYESNNPSDATKDGLTAKKDLMRYGKFERANVRLGRTDQQATLSIFLVASVLEGKNKRLLQEAKGLDDVVQVVPFSFPLIQILSLLSFFRSIKIGVFLK